MRIVNFFLLFSIVLLVVGCRGCFRGVSDAVLPNGGNPELITYLQGTWVLASNEKSTIHIQRDSIIEVNDSARSTKNLSYQFAGTAESYFTKDSAFDFSSENGRSLSTDEFKLLENVPTKRGARTITVDPSTHTVYLPTAEFGASTGQGRPPLVPGSFQVLVMTKK